MAIIKNAKNINIQVNNEYTSICKVSYEESEEVIIEATKENLELSSQKKTIMQGFGKESEMEEDEEKEKEIFPTSVNLECSKITEYNIAVGETREVKFKVIGKNDDKKREIKFELNNANISLSTSSWKAENEWVIKTKITGNKEGNSIITVKAEDKTLNTIKIKCVNYKDVFSEKEVQKLIDENSSLIKNDKVCFRVADKGISKLLSTTATIINSYGGENSYSRAKTIKSQGYIKDEIVINQYSFDTGGLTKPKKFTSGKETIISESLDKTIGNKMGYHVYYFSILKGYHVLLLVVDASDLCMKKFKAYDQLKDRGDYLEYKKINEFLLEMTVNNWEGSASRNKDKTANTEIAIWKIKRK